MTTTNNLKKGDSEALQKRIVQLLTDGKAQDILPLDLRTKTSLADYIIMASGTSTRHVMALATTLAETLKKEGYAPRLEGKQSTGAWVVLDLGDIIVHLFHPETRSFYAIEELWGQKSPKKSEQ